MVSYYLPIDNKTLSPKIKEIFDILQISSASILHTKEI